MLLVVSLDADTVARLDYRVQQGLHAGGGDHFAVGVCCAAAQPDPGVLRQGVPRQLLLHVHGAVFPEIGSTGIGSAACIMRSSRFLPLRSVADHRG
jgi:hypothetical protein